MPELAQVLKLLNLATPYICAAATFALFHWLDNIVSNRAKRALSSRLRPMDHNKVAIVEKTLQFFDRIYTAPLLARRAFCRSLMATLATLILILFWFLPSWHQIIGDNAWDTAALGLFLLVVILLNYMTLFIIRLLLSISDGHLFVGVVLGPMIGIILVLSFVATRDLLLQSVGATVLTDAYRRIGSGTGASYALHTTILLAGVAVNLGVPALAFWAGLLKGLNYSSLTGLNFFLSVIMLVQGFLKRGKEHPLDAIGFVAAPLVFIVAMLVQMLVSSW